MNNKIINIVFFILLIVLIVWNCRNEFFSNSRHNHHKKTKSNKKDICRGYLTDIEYLNHMIPHHQVAVDISLELQKVTKSPIMHQILRQLIYNQKMEINIMKQMRKRLPTNMTENIPKSKYYQPTISDYMKPNKIGLTKTYCDPHFFDPKGHMKHIKHMKLNDKTYLEHMIPHHQVAVDMSKVLIKNTKNDFMIYLAYRIIRSQQGEIILLNDFLNKSKKYNQSEIL
jgi:uncharacterized protein (DUF305 family)|tara:strand:- start:15 stop:695 length:681 start_codon:yes stop_codon:yes gene_type:complete